MKYSTFYRQLADILSVNLTDIGLDIGLDPDLINFVKDLQLSYFLGIINGRFNGDNGDDYTEDIVVTVSIDDLLYKVILL